MIIVTGATGNIGRPLVQNLVTAGYPVTAVSRGVSSPALDAPGVVPVVADLAATETLEPVLDGAEALFLLVSGAGGHVDGPALLGTAKAAGVRRVVLVSSQAAGTRAASPSYAPLAALEETVRGSGLDWTVLRPSGFMTNTFAWAPGVRVEQTVRVPFADVALPLVDPRDIADVAAAALVDDSHAGRTYDLTGPEATTPRRRVELLGSALGRPLRLVELSPGQARDEMLQVMPAPVVEGTLAILGEPLAHEQRVSADVPDVTGRPGRTFATWATDNAAAFR
ncbi:NAD(P)H-binding protein [Cellulosimicrobium terreum]|nr:NAD(P)H-binding protein [Cellulosimicrobium terreum]